MTEVDGKMAPQDAVDILLQMAKDVWELVDPEHLKECNDKFEALMMGISALEDKYPKIVKEGEDVG